MLSNVVRGSSLALVSFVLLHVVGVDGIRSQRHVIRDWISLPDDEDCIQPTSISLKSVNPTSLDRLPVNVERTVTLSVDIRRQRPLSINSTSKPANASSSQLVNHLAFAVTSGDRDVTVVATSGLDLVRRLQCNVDNLTMTFSVLGRRLGRASLTVSVHLCRTVLSRATTMSVKQCAETKIASEKVQVPNELAMPAATVSEETHVGVTLAGQNVENRAVVTVPKLISSSELTVPQAVPSTGLRLLYTVTIVRRVRSVDVVFKWTMAAVGLVNGFSLGCVTDHRHLTPQQLRQNSVALLIAVFCQFLLSPIVS